MKDQTKQEILLMCIAAAGVLLAFMYAIASHDLIPRKEIVGDVELTDGTILKQKAVNHGE